MKGISTIMATIILVVITIGLIGTAYIFFGGLLTGMTSKTISIIHAKGHSITIRNDGTDTINVNDIRVIVNGEDVDIINSEIIEPSKTKILKFIPPNFGSELKSAKVIISGPSNSLFYTTDLIPHAPKSISNTVGLWHFDSVNVSDYTLDESSYHNDGILTNMDPATDLVDGKFGKALEFDGTDDYVNISDSDSLDVKKKITISVWFNFTSLPSTYPRIVSKESSTTAEPYALEIRRSTNRVDFCLNTTGTENCDTNTTINSIEPNKWYHVVATWNGSMTWIYLNGELKDNRNLGGTMIETANNILIGNNPDSANPRQFNGIIDEVMIINRSLTQEEIIDSIYG